MCIRHEAAQTGIAQQAFCEGNENRVVCADELVHRAVLARLSVHFNATPWISGCARPFATFHAWKSRAKGLGAKDNVWDA
jgi:hypothetical protein